MKSCEYCKYHMYNDYCGGRPEGTCICKESPNCLKQTHILDECEFFQKKGDKGREDD